MGSLDELLLPEPKFPQTLGLLLRDEAGHNREAFQVLNIFEVELLSSHHLLEPLHDLKVVHIGFAQAVSVLWLPAQPLVVHSLLTPRDAQHVEAGLQEEEVDECEFAEDIAELLPEIQHLADLAYVLGVVHEFLVLVLDEGIDVLAAVVGGIVADVEQDGHRLGLLQQVDLQDFLQFGLSSWRGTRVWAF